jgi:hypothetical protein
VFYTERVELSCTVEGSSEWKFTWFRDSKEIQADHVVLSTDGTTLSIPAASVVDAGKYMCKGQHKNRTLTTHNSDELPLTVNGESSLFRCFKDKRGIPCAPCHHATS